MDQIHNDKSIYRILTKMPLNVCVCHFCVSYKNYAMVKSGLLSMLGVLLLLCDNLKILAK